MKTMARRMKAPMRQAPTGLARRGARLVGALAIRSGLAGQFASHAPSAVGVTTVGWSRSHGP